MTAWVKAYGAALGAFLVLDALWLGLVMRDFYADALAPWMADPVRWGWAAAFYLLYVAGVLYLAGAPANGNLAKAASRGAVLGGLAYGTWNSVNLAIVQDWPAHIAPADTAWGMAVTAAVASVGAWAGPARQPD